MQSLKRYMSWPKHLRSVQLNLELMEAARELGPEGRQVVKSLFPDMLNLAERLLETAGARRAA
jgi:hypothetical protein